MGTSIGFPLTGTTDAIVSIYRAMSERLIVSSEARERAPASGERHDDLVSLGLMDGCGADDPFDAYLHRADLRGRNLAGVSLREVSFVDVDLTDADLRGADLRDSKLVRVILRGARLDRANLNGVEFVSVDIKAATFTDATMDGALIDGRTLESCFRSIAV